MTTPPPGIFIEGSDHHHYLEYSVTPDGDPEALIAAVADLSPLASTPAVNMVVAFGAHLWSRLSPAAAPDGFSPFDASDGDEGHSIPGTQRDIFVWIHGDRLDDVFDAALAVQGRLKPVADLVLDERGFIRHESHDLTGFVDK